MLRRGIEPIREPVKKRAQRILDRSDRLTSLARIAHLA
jgi:hypothetical protein